MTTQTKTYDVKLVDWRDEKVWRIVKWDGAVGTSRILDVVDCGEARRKDAKWYALNARRDGFVPSADTPDEFAGRGKYATKEDRERAKTSE